MMLANRSFFVIAIVFSIGALALGGKLDVGSRPEKSRKVEFINESGKKLVVDWINPKTGESVPLSAMYDGAKLVFDSYVNHTFAVHEPTTSPSCGVNEDDCGIQYVTIADDSEQVTLLKEGMVISRQVPTVESSGSSLPSLEKCREMARGNLGTGDAESSLAALASCLERATTTLIKQKNEEIAFESQLRKGISVMMENHTCADTLRETTPPKELRSWTHQEGVGNVIRQVGILHDRRDSQIHAIENFISKEECDAITESAAKKLHRGTVADGSGGSRLSEHRKAWQASVKVPWDKEDQGDLIARVVRRIYDYTNDAVHYNLTIEGQEDLMSIQYFGIGKDSTETPDQYRPHCDGDCDGLPHKTGGRVATMVMYCDAPDVGGGTNFQNANVFVKPKVGAAAFFSYLNPHTMEKEDGWTSHSGCPVIEGTKRIAVHWMRYGVDVDNPWDSFNTLTIKREDEDC